MEKYTQRGRYEDQEIPPLGRMNYGEILDHLIYVGDERWTFIAYAPKTGIADRLKRAADARKDFDWEYTLEVFTRRMRPNGDGSPGYEIWAVVHK